MQTDSKPLICVLITFYNQEQYVDRAINSVISQKTDCKIKILIGDDGSSDSTYYILKKWANLYPDVIKIYRNEREKKKYIGGFRASQNRLSLLKHVDTPFFIFLDGDDYYSDDFKLKKQLDVLMDPMNSDCIACCHNMDIVSGNKIEKTTSQKLSEGRISPRQYWKKHYIHTDSLLIRSSIINKYPYQLIENHFNDILITFLSIQNGSIYFLTDSMAVYHHTQNGIWTSNHIVVNCIRNIMIYDLCNLINPDFKKETDIRFSKTWFYLLTNRNNIKKNDLYDLVLEAEKKKLYYSSIWVKYEELNELQKIQLIVKSILKSRWYFMESIKQFIKRFLF